MNVVSANELLRVIVLRIDAKQFADEGDKMSPEAVDDQLYELQLLSLKVQELILKGRAKGLWEACYHVTR